MLEHCSTKGALLCLPLTAMFGRGRGGGRGGGFRGGRGGGRGGESTVSCYSYLSSFVTNLMTDNY